MVDILEKSHTCKTSTENRNPPDKIIVTYSTVITALSCIFSHFLLITG